MVNNDLKEIYLLFICLIYMIVYDFQVNIGVLINLPAIKENDNKKKSSKNILFSNYILIPNNLKLRHLI